MNSNIWYSGKYNAIREQAFITGFKVILFQTETKCLFKDGYAWSVVYKGWYSYSIVPNSMKTEDVHCEFSNKSRNMAELLNAIDFAKECILSGKTELIKIENE